ncbi:MAG: hypothetical protein ACRDKS_06985 [Actinomycetota bacterium]
MRHRDIRFVRAAAVLFAAAVVVFGGVIPAAADVNAASVKVTDPIQSEVLAGSYDADGTASGFKVTLKGQATTTCPAGWSSIKFTVTATSYSQTFTVTAPATETWSGNAPTQWDTQALRNGIYTIRLDVVEKPKQGALDSKCASQSGSHYVTAKVANPAEAPAWYADPAPASDGSASVTLRWKKNGEPDVLEYHIVRTGPDGTKIAPVSAGSPGSQGCSLTSSVYVCEDTAFGDNYGGGYTYGIVAVRERPAYNSSEAEIECKTIAKPCVVSAGSAIQNVTLTEPDPSPSPGGGGGVSSSPPPPKAPGSDGGKPKPGTGSGGTHVLSFGGSSDFYTGTYSETLPYTPRSFILGGGSATSSPKAQGYQGDVISETAPDYRTIMLPVAGGLLAFLSAAHVRRLLLHL